MASPIPEIERGLDARVEALGLQVVDVEWAGLHSKPILRLRVDLPDSRPGHGVTVAHCVQVSRALEPWLDEHPLLPERYNLEVSSPGVERPLVRKRDFVRFAGSEIAVKTKAPLPGRDSTRVEGVLESVSERGAATEEFAVALRMKDGSSLDIPGSDIVRAKLVYRWNDGE